MVGSWLAAAGQVGKKNGKVVLGKCQAVVSKLIISIKRSRWLVYVVGSSEWMVAIAKCQLAMITGLIRTN
jgi:ABC-type proline/glycine betaine transport system substrate-binding protein